MKIDQHNQKEFFYELGGLAELEVNPQDISPDDFGRFLVHMHNQLILVPGNQTKLRFSQPLTTPQCARLALYVSKYKHQLCFTELSLALAPELVNSQELRDLILCLNHSSIKLVNLETNNAVTIDNILPLGADAFFPISVPEPTFVFEQVMQNMHAKYAGRKHPPAMPDLHGDLAPQAVINAEQNPLKQFIYQDPTAPKNVSQYISLETQHIETQVQTAAVQLDVNVQNEAQAIYNADLIDFQKFNAPPYSDWAKAKFYHNHAYYDYKSAMEIAEREIFANLPNAIQYLSPAAAEVLAKHLDIFCSLNLDNLPQNFLLKKTPNGQIVLDYDLNAPKRAPDPFRPREITNYRTTDKIYPVEFYNGSPRFYCHAGNENSFIKYGPAGIKKLNKALAKIPTLLYFTKEDVIFEQYFSQFNHLDHFFENDSFFESVDQIATYSEVKRRCLGNFLRMTFTSAYDLKTSLIGFEAFWEQWEQLSKQHNVDIARINNGWLTPRGGNPIVYMERLIKILKNARNLSEQLDCLPGLCLDHYGAYYASINNDFKTVSSNMGFKYDPRIHARRKFNPDEKAYRVDLEHILEYTFYYDRLYNEAKEKGICYLIQSDQQEISADEYLQLEQDKKAANITAFADRSQRDAEVDPSFKPYRKNSDGSYSKIFDKVAGLNYHYDSYKFETNIYRYVGQQETGISVTKLTEAINRIYDDRQNPFAHSFNNENGAERSSHQNGTLEILLYSLLFITHDRFAGETADEIKDLILSFPKIRDEQSLHDLFLELLKLYKLDIRLNLQEGISLIKCLANLDQIGYHEIINANGDNVRLNSIKAIESQYIAKLMQRLRANKNAVYKLLAKLSTRPNRVFMFAIDTEEYLAKDDPDIARVYRDDLLLLAELLNKDPYCEYYHNRPGFKDSWLEIYLHEIKSCLHLAATKQSPNLEYAFRKLIAANEYISTRELYRALQQIRKLKDFDAAAVDTILTENKFTITAAPVVIVSSQGMGVRATLTALLLLLNSKAELAVLDASKIEDIRSQINQYWSNAANVDQTSLQKLLQQLKAETIEHELKALNTAEFTKFRELLTAKFCAWNIFSDADSPDKINNIANSAKKLANLFVLIAKRNNFNQRLPEFMQLFSSMDFDQFDYESLFALLELLAAMPQRDYHDILAAICARPAAERAQLIPLIRTLDLAALPSKYILQITLNTAPSEFAHIQTLAKLLAEIIVDDPNDPVVEWMFSSAALSMDQILTITQITAGYAHDRTALSQLLKHLNSQQPAQLDAFLKAIATITDTKYRITVLEIIAATKAKSSSKTPDTGVNYPELATKISTLTPSEIDKLAKFCKQTPISSASLYTGLCVNSNAQPMQAFLSSFEKSPFGARDFAAQFDTQQVERVVNAFIDLNNNQPYSYTRRKQIMEAFLFVNRAGNDLPLYFGLPAKALSNAQIQELFQKIKTKDKSLAHLDDFQRHLYALALMREAMYRATGQFPYSTQMIALIDCMLQPGDVISNIDTGQGKSLVDTMKAALLFLESTRVDISTSSIVDAKRDAEIYAPFFNILNIDNSTNPVTATTAISDYLSKGINYSTIAQLALFHGKNLANGQVIGQPNDVVSLVLNESDYTILDDKTIYRYAAPNKLPAGNEWIYTAIIQFVSSAKFCANNTSKQQDILDLREFLIKYAEANNKSPDFINNLIKDDQLETWINSAIVAKYCLRPNFDYVITPQAELKLIAGKKRLTKLAKILMKDGRVSNDTQYGNGMHQLLHAKLNLDNANEAFIIEPESSTIISLNNRIMLDYYRNSNGYIWGSSGTVGDPAEIQRQFEDYGFSFSQLEAHQQKQVQPDTKLENNETEQFAAIMRGIIEDRKHGRPVLVFFKDIETCNRFFAAQANDLGADSQIYTGLGDEEQIIKTAAKPGMVTVTTVLGRNTDVAYIPEVGMTVYQGFIDTKRKSDQRSGRTGRQGSPGYVHFILNKLDYKDITADKLDEYIADFAKHIQEQAESDHNFNEPLYKILGYLLRAVVNAVPTMQIEDRKNFFLNTWAKLSSDLENEFRQLRLKQSFASIEAEFVDKAVQRFQQDAKISIRSQDIIAELHAQNVKPAAPIVYTEPVQIKDCTAAEIIAYQFVGLQGNDPDIKLGALTTYLQSIFQAASNGGNPEAAHLNYIKFLQENKVQLAEIRLAHKTFLNQFLNAQISTTNNHSKAGIIQRWRGLESPLNKIAADENYLILFKALCDITNNSKLKPDDLYPELDILPQLKKSLTALLTEYLQNSWFVSPSKKRKMQQLLTAVKTAENTTQLIAAICSMQVTVSAEDITSQRSFYRHFRPLHRKGHSRFQASLANALALTSALTGQAPDPTIISQLKNQLNELATKTKHDDYASLDQFKATPQGVFSYRDRHNAAVVTKTMEAVLKHQPAQNHGMKTRRTLFPK